MDRLGVERGVACTQVRGWGVRQTAKTARQIAARLKNSETARQRDKKIGIRRLRIRDAALFSAAVCGDKTRRYGYVREAAVR